MTTIKIESDTLKETAAKATTAITEYKEKVINSATIFLDISSELSGSGYDSLIEQMNQKIESQKRVVVECELLAEEIENYAEEMSNAESSVSFPS